MLQTVLSKDGYEIIEADDGQGAISRVESESFDLIMLDLRMKHVQGIQALQKIKQMRPSIPVLIMTAYASVETAVNGLKLGALDYLLKPLDMDLVREKIRSILSNDENPVTEDNPMPIENLDFDFSHIIGKSREIRNLLETLKMVAPTDATVLILGESGSGKELVSNALQYNSLRDGKPFIKINCAAIPDSLLESELFGHEKGAFTGAIARRQGRFEQADGGTIMLDEIGDMSLPTQAKILRVIQDGEFQRLGGNGILKVDVRIIAATNRDLEVEVSQGRFREDLYFRLSVIPVEIPPLRRRLDDIPLLANFFLERYAKKNRRSIFGFHPETMDILMKYDWPGNVRELENIVERAVILCRHDHITLDGLPPSLLKAETNRDVNVNPGTTGIDQHNHPDQHKKNSGGVSLKEAERELILSTLKETGYNITQTAKILGITRRGLQYKLKDMGIQSP
jgi:two-component system response regulator HydG